MIYKLNEGPITQHIIAKHCCFFIFGGGVWGEVFSFVNFWEKGLFTFTHILMQKK